MLTGLNAYHTVTDMGRSDNRAQLMADIWNRININLQLSMTHEDTKLLKDSMTLVNDGLIASVSEVEGSDLPAKLLALYRWYYQTLSKQVWTRDSDTLNRLINIAKTQENAWRQIA